MLKLIEKKDGYSIKKDTEKGNYLLFFGRKKVGTFSAFYEAEQGIKQHKEIKDIAVELGSLLLPPRKNSTKGKVKK